jgi:hypothetical protein
MEFVQTGIVSQPHTLHMLRTCLRWTSSKLSGGNICQDFSIVKEHIHIRSTRVDSIKLSLVESYAIHKVDIHIEMAHPNTIMIHKRYLTGCKNPLSMSSVQMNNRFLPRMLCKGRFFRWRCALNLILGYQLSNSERCFAKSTQLVVSGWGSLHTEMMHSLQ